MKEKPAAINIIWFALIVIAVLVGMAKGNLETVQKVSFDAAKSAVTLAINLIGVMALWLGIMKVAEVGGLMKIIARAIRPLMVRLFPNVPAEHPAMAAMIMNIAANMLGLGNAATPLGIKAMIELEKLNKVPGRATNAMCLFLAINTSSVTILPLGVIGVRAAAGSTEPAAIMVPTMLATFVSTTVAIVMSKFFEKANQDDIVSVDLDSCGDTLMESEEATEKSSAEVLVKPALTAKVFAYGSIIALLAVIVYRFATTAEIELMQKEILRFWIVPLLMLAILLFGYIKGVKVYEVACEGAKEGFQVAIRIIPFLVMILVAIGMFKASGAFEILAYIIAPITNAAGVPAEVLPMAMMRPLSGSGAFGVMAELVQQNPDSLAAYMASIMQGSTETTFYVLAVYFGAVGITKTRYAIAAALMADAAGIVASIVMAKMTFGA